MLTDLNIDTKMNVKRAEQILDRPYVVPTVTRNREYVGEVKFVPRKTKDIGKLDRSRQPGRRWRSR